MQYMALDAADIASISDAYAANMAALRAVVLSRGKFAWQMMWSPPTYPGAPAFAGNTCPGPLVHKASCAADLRALCAPASPQYSRAMMYAFSPGKCVSNTAKLESFEQDLAGFLLTRGDYAWLGHGWQGCSQVYEFPQALNGDYGEPKGLCAETAAGSEVFTRAYSKATVTLDCKAWVGRIDAA